MTLVKFSAIIKLINNIITNLYMKYFYPITMAVLTLVILVSASSFAALPKPPYKPTTPAVQPTSTLGTTTSTVNVGSGVSNTPTSNSATSTGTTTSVLTNSAATAALKLCPVNTTVIAGTAYCQDGLSIYGVFPKNIVVNCVKYSVPSSKTCTTSFQLKSIGGANMMYMRYNYNFFKALNK